ncbi:hypothetical protein [Paraburkholderia sp. BL10I2N1]|uniref:hypothetical protein n=1 Tax=Paraburkholderia sp. BL10I2N1 TaxID=1938796 RepID=UPI00105C9B82|nr:hypothetical protein [Paraburkholderia sp. BL10I2N1]TDN63267.1 hypothetical protein B0G77_6910 [Paraburkholderia sp. BL10I2N1]
MKHGLVVGLLCGALLAGCMSAGVEVRPEQMSNFKPGVTTLQDVTATLGPASVQTALDDGSTLLVYTFVTSRPHPESFLPFIGALVGGADTRSSAAVFLFNSLGILKTANTATSNVGTGLSADLHSKPTPDVKPPVVVKSIQPPAVQSIEPLPEEDVQPAPENSVEPPQEQSVQPVSNTLRRTSVIPYQ